MTASSGALGTGAVSTVATTAARSVAFEAFYLSERSAVVRALVLTLGDRELALDAADEAFARAYQRWGRIAVYERPGAWVYRVGLNWARSTLRRVRRPVRTFREEHEPEPEVADADLARALAALSVPHRAVVVCRFLLGWSVADTAAALRVAEGTVKSRLHRALAELERQLSDPELKGVPCRDGRC